MIVSFRVLGFPMPKGSYTKLANGHVINARRGPAAKLYKTWVESIHRTAKDKVPPAGALDGPLNLAAVFYFPRPKHETRAERLRMFKTSKPDLSKLIRALEDPMVDAGLLADDARVVSFFGCEKRYVPYAAVPIAPRVEVIVSQR